MKNIAFRFYTPPQHALVALQTIPHLRKLTKCMGNTRITVGALLNAMKTLAVCRKLQNLLSPTSFPKPQD